MKHYLDLVPLSAKRHVRENKMTLFCIILSVLLITGLFSMADLFIRSQIRQTIREGGNWHIAVRNITDEQAKLIALRPDVRYAARYGVRNYRADEAYTMGGRDVILCGCDEAWLTRMQEDVLEEGSFPTTDAEALVTQNARKRLGLKIGSSVTVEAPDKTRLSFLVSGFVRDNAKLQTQDSYGLFLNTEAMRKWVFPEASGTCLEDYNSILCVQFSDTYHIQRSMQEIREAFGFTENQITENTRLTGLLGQSGSTLMGSIYATAGVLAILVMLAGVMMISGSLGSSVAQKTQFYGMLRCIGATPKQVARLVRREALRWCCFAIPMGLCIALGIVWILSALLRFLSPQYFGEMPVFSISIPGMAAGALIGIWTVLLAAHVPAKRAARASALEAVSGNASQTAPVHRAANTRHCKIETALGLHHAVAGKRNFFLMTGSFAFSILLFLAFSVTVAFMQNSLVALEPWTPDLSIVSADNSLSIAGSLLDKLRENPAVKRVYARSFAYHLPARIEETAVDVTLISYEQYQFDWAKKYLLDGRDSMETVQQQPLTGLFVYNPELDTPIQTGDTVSLTIDGKIRDIQIVGGLAKCPFHSEDGAVLICSEESFRQLTGEENYTILDIQLKRGALESEIAAIQEMAGTKYQFSDRRLSNQSVKGVSDSFKLCIYGFLMLIALITICNIINSISLSVSARTRQYGVLRAIGLSSRQLSKMVIAEAFAYALTGSAVGVILGLVCNRALFEVMITRNWGRQWAVPWTELGIILVLVLVSVVVAVREPVKRLRRLSVVDTIQTGTF